MTVGKHDPTFRRKPAPVRREALIEATLSLIAEKGIAAATVRAIARHADVSQGLIRHYFSTKEDLVAAAYDAHMQRLMLATDAPLRTAPDRPANERLATFVAGSLRPPSLDPGSVSLWAGFFSKVRSDAAMRASHQRHYTLFRDRLRDLIGEALNCAGRSVGPDEQHRMAVACNAVIDGLWLEGGALPEFFEPEELVSIGLRSVSDITGLDLSPGDAAT